MKKRMPVLSAVVVAAAAVGTGALAGSSDTAGASLPRTDVAGRRSTRSFVTAVSSVTLLSLTLPRTTTPLLSFERISSGAWA